MISVQYCLCRFFQFCLLARVILARIFSCLLSNSDFWLISERGREARDNGYALYRWIKSNHPEIPIKYVITKDSKDYCRIEQGDVVVFNSFKHLVCIWKARYLISTHIMGFTPSHEFFSVLDSKMHLFRNKRKIFLQHGITKDRIEAFFYGNIDVDLFVSGSAIEYRYIEENFGFPKDIVKYTGLCRYDNLFHYETKRQILIMPTFRMYIDRNHFEDSDYYIAYKNLLCSKTFVDILERYDYHVVFYPHYEFQSKILSFQKLSLSKRIIIADMSYDVQQLLKESNLLITDFSSVFFDMMYMNKPIVFYQFDEERYRSAHYKQGYLNYREVGPVTDSLPDLLREIEMTLLNKGDISRYLEYYNQTFTMRDTSNCERVYEAIVNCGRINS